MKLGKLAALACISVVLGACAQQEEPPSIRPQPQFDKFGGGSCEEGYVYIPGTVPQPAECIPEDDCDPITLADGQVVWDCPPPPPTRDRGDDRDGRDDSSRPDPTTGART